MFHHTSPPVPQPPPPAPSMGFFTPGHAYKLDRPGWPVEIITRFHCLTVTTRNGEKLAFGLWRDPTGSQHWSYRVLDAAEWARRWVRTGPAAPAAPSEAMDRLNSLFHRTSS